MIEFLSRSDIKDKLLSALGASKSEYEDEVRGIMARLRLEPQEIFDFYRLQEKLDKTTDERETYQLKREMIAAVSGFHAKTDKRVEKIKALHQILSEQGN